MIHSILSFFFFISAGALVMPRPSPNHQWSNNKSGLPVVDVVVDPHLTSHLRPHQRDGLLFLYECVMGLRYYGCSCNMSCQVLFKETCLNLTAVTIIGIPNGSWRCVQPCVLQSCGTLWSYPGWRDGSGEDPPERGAVLDVAQTRTLWWETSCEACLSGHTWQPCAELGCRVQQVARPWKDQCFHCGSGEKRRENSCFWIYWKLKLPDDSTSRTISIKSEVSG